MSDGGAAFSGEYCHEDPAKFNQGMSLRDYFAAKAMPRLIPTEGWTDMHIEKCAQEAAEQAYRVADAMLAERSKEPKP